jgi:hypothetical protein
MWNFAQGGQPMDRKDRHVATVLAGIRRTQGRPPEQKEAILPEHLLAMVATLDLGDLRGLRDLGARYSKAKMRFQSFFMLITNQPFLIAKS